MLREGCALVTQTTKSGEEKQVRRLEEYSCFGERALLTAEPRSANVVAETKVMLLFYFMFLLFLALLPYPYTGVRTTIPSYFVALYGYHIPLTAIPPYVLYSTIPIYRHTVPSYHHSIIPSYGCSTVPLLCRYIYSAIHHAIVPLHTGGEKGRHL